MSGLTAHWDYGSTGPDSISVRVVNEDSRIIHDAEYVSKGIKEIAAELASDTHVGSIKFHTVPKLWIDLFGPYDFLKLGFLSIRTNEPANG